MKLKFANSEYELKSCNIRFYNPEDGERTTFMKSVDCDLLDIEDINSIFEDIQTNFTGSFQIQLRDSTMSYESYELSDLSLSINKDEIHNITIVFRQEVI